MTELKDLSYTVEMFGETITWNTTRTLRDALTGAFGKVVSIPMTDLPPLTVEMAKRLNWRRVEELLGGHLRLPQASPLDLPALQVTVKYPDRRIRIPVDGNHRIAARCVAGYPDFICWIVPWKLEGLYRVRDAKIGGETPPAS